MHQIYDFNGVDLPSTRLEVPFDGAGGLGVGLSELTVQNACDKDIQYRMSP